MLQWYIHTHIMFEVIPDFFCFFFCLFPPSGCCYARCVCLGLRNLYPSEQLKHIWTKLFTFMNYIFHGKAKQKRAFRQFYIFFFFFSGGFRRSGKEESMLAEKAKEFCISDIKCCHKSISFNFIYFREPACIFRGLRVFTLPADGETKAKRGGQICADPRQCNDMRKSTLQLENYN